IQFQYIASTTDPGPTAWRLLHLGTHGLTSISVGLLFAPENTTSLPADKGVRVLPILPIYGTLADMSKSMNWRRSRREREEKKAGTCAHVKGIVSGRKRRRHIRNVTRARVRTMKWKRKGGHRVYTWPKPQYENRARFFDTERGKPAQKPTPTSPTHRSHPKENAAVRKVILAAYKISTYHKYFRPRSHRVEVAASGDPRTNGGSTLYYFYYYQESKAARRLPLPMNSSLQTLKLQPHAFPYLGTDLHITQLSNIGSFDHHHLSTTDCASRQTPEPKIESYRTHRYLREYSGNTHANMLNTLDPILDLIAPENTNAYAIPRWSLGDATIAVPGKKRTNEDSTRKSTNRDAFPLRELLASQQTGDIAPLSTPSASDISRHDRSCLFRYFKEQNEVLGRTKSRDREQPRACRPSHAYNFNILQVLPTQVPPLGDIWDPRRYVEVHELEEKQKRKRRKESRDMRACEEDSIRKKKKKAYPECNTCTCENDEMEEKSYTWPKPQYENRARFFDTERGKPAQKPTPTSPTHRSHPKENAAVRKVILAAYKISTYHKYFRPRSHRVEVAASGDPRTNGGSTLYYFYYYQESKAARRLPLPMNSSLQTLKLQPHAFPYLGTDLHITQLSNIGSFDHHHLSTTDCASRQTPEPKIESYRTHRYLREYSGNTHANMLNTLDPILDLIAPENTNAYAIPRWSLGDATIAVPGKKRTNEDSTRKSTNRDAFPLRELLASQQTGDIAPLSTPSASDISRHDRSCLFRYFKEQNEVLDTISIYCKYYRPRSHRLEVAASGDPRANGDSTLNYTWPKPQYENRARFFDTERGKPAQKPTPTSPTHRSHPKENAAVRKVILAAYKISTYHKYFRPRSHRVEVAASGDPRTNGGSTLYYFYYYQESKAARRLPLPMNSSLQTLKLQPHAFPYLGTDLHITQLSNIGSFDHHHLSTTDCASRQTPEPKIESYRTHRYLREYSGNTHANMLNTLDPILDLIAPENTNAYAIPRWSLGDATIAVPGKKRTNEDSTRKSTDRDAFPLRELLASQQTGDIAPLSTPSASDISRHDRSCLFRYFKEQNEVLDCRYNLISIFRKYCRPGSHHLEVAASGDPRANGDSTLKSTIRDAFPLRVLRASQQTGDV
ncbi:LOW QUALITY PROTEIN: hypothetical protein V1477_018627, partial [Vespula maculifrons]